MIELSIHPLENTKYSQKEETIVDKSMIIKALECCGEMHECSICPRYDHNNDLCQEDLHGDAIALIKELTEEIKKLTSINISKDIIIEGINEVIKQLNEENESLTAEVSVKKKLLDKCVDLEDRVRADTVREFAERLKKECLVDSGYEVLQIGTIDRIAKEMTGNKEEECPSCKHFAGCECFDGETCDLYEEGGTDVQNK